MAIDWEIEQRKQMYGPRAEYDKLQRSTQQIDPSLGSREAREALGLARFEFFKRGDCFSDPKKIHKAKGSTVPQLALTSECLRGSPGFKNHRRNYLRRPLDDFRWRCRGESDDGSRVTVSGALRSEVGDAAPDGGGSCSQVCEHAMHWNASTWLIWLVNGNQRTFRAPQCAHDGRIVGGRAALGIE